jgi:hypothetical protein
LKEDSLYIGNKSVSVFFNTAQPIIQSSFISEHARKWIFFRCLARNEKYGNFFRDLDLLGSHHFEKFFFIPDFLHPQYRNKNFVVPTIDYLVSKQIDISNLSHLSLFDGEELSLVKKNYDPKKTLSSGFWIYLYLRGLYPTATFTLVGYNSVIDPAFHDPSFEKAYILCHLQNKLCRLLLYN